MDRVNEIAAGLFEDLETQFGNGVGGEVFEAVEGSKV